ncbi:hypothetical protein AAG747_17710 [Rapidithrix thailandica]|uniref:Outer membrane protein transport protein (OMPP1/FadL/TodX) n=1 Tax=Rapidithrix thailandica TaxID=413964 RepID=A0AAW9SBA8_9BACT
MKTLKIVILLTLSFVSFTFTTQAQFFEDALRFSRTRFGGSVRYQSIAGAGVALGGDISNALSNPAGLGFSRRSEWSISPALAFNNTTSDFFGESTDDSKLNMNISHLGAVFSKARNSLTAFKGGAFAITLTRVNDFQNKFAYEGTNPNNSIADFFQEEVHRRGVPYGFYLEEEDFGISEPHSLFYFTYLLNPVDNSDPNQTEYYTFKNLAPNRQREEVTTKGAQYVINFSYGANFDDRFYIGGTVGVNTLRYERTRILSETPENSVANDYPVNNLVYQVNQGMGGVGINAKIGMIYRPTDLVRFGFTATTPTVYRITDDYNASLFVQYNNFVFNDSIYQAEEYGRVGVGDNRNITLTNQNASVALESFDYSLVTPYRLEGGVAFFIGKSGFISGDVEYVNYSSINLVANSENDFATSQGVIDNEYQSALNFRVGGEYRWKLLRFRAGFAQYGSPFKSFVNRDETRQFFTGGVGLRKKDFYLDLGVVAQKDKFSFAPYDITNPDKFPNPGADISHSKVQAIISFGMFY